MLKLKNLSGGLKPKLLAVVGPTASGKTDLAIKIAQKFDGEIICADSRTVYKGLNIGTAKPTPEERRTIQHFGLDLIDPDQRFSAAEFKKRANEWIADIETRGKLPIVVGGTGMYIDGLLYNYSFAAPNAERSPDNPRHLNKSAEVSKEPLRPGTVIIGLDPGKEELTRRIETRADKMLKSGGVGETEWLIKNYGGDSPGASGNVYQVLKQHLNGKLSLEECKQELVRLDKYLAKRQRTWFKRNADIHWFSDARQAEQFLDSLL